MSVPIEAASRSRPVRPAWWRYQGYWLSDRLKGAPVARQLANIKALVADPKQAYVHAEERSARLLAHAIRTTDHYAQYAGASSIRELPVLQKRSIRERYDAFVSRAFDRGALEPAATSGSYGAPLTFLLSGTKGARKKAERIWSYEIAGVAHPLRYGTIMARKATELTARALLVGSFVFDPTALTDEWCDAVLARIARYRLHFVQGYPSALSAVASRSAARGQGRSALRLNAVMTWGEALDLEARRQISAALCCPVVSRYSTEEFGTLAQECRENLCFHLNTASYLWEVLRLDSDQPCDKGEVGRIVVTDLYSDAMPLIRYDTGDMGALAGECACGRPGPTLVSLEGRTIEAVQSTQGGPVSPFAINGAMRDLEGIARFQFVQRASGEYLVRLVTIPSFSQEPVIRSRLLALLGTDASLHFAYVDDIPPLPSGKRPYIVNETASRGPTASSSADRSGAH